MKITEITASFGKTVQTEPYSPANWHCSVKAEVDGDIEKNTAKLFEMAKDGVKAQVRFYNENKKKLEEKERKEKEKIRDAFAKKLTPIQGEGRYENRN